MSTQYFVYIVFGLQLNVKIVLFQTIHFSMSTKLNGSKYYHVSLTIQTTL